MIAAESNLLASLLLSLFSFNKRFSYRVGCLFACRQNGNYSFSYEIYLLLIVFVEEINEMKGITTGL